MHIITTCANQKLHSECAIYLTGYGEYVQVDLTGSGTYKVTGVKTQGCPDDRCCGEKWVAQYEIQYSGDGTSWTIFTEGGANKVRYVIIQVV